jgi:hypothetical protein
MTNTVLAVTGDIIRYVGETTGDLTKGDLFEVTGHGYSDWMAGNYAEFTDKSGRPRAFWKPSKYEIVGKVNPPPTLTDIQGNTISKGDTIAYAFAGAQSRHLALFEVQAINGPVALCRAKADGAVINLGVFEERAIIVS